MPRLDPGPELNEAEADQATHQFFAALSGDRDVTFFSDPLEHVRANALLLLFDTEAADAFESYLSRMSSGRVAEWRDLIAGGASSEAFGPLTLQERLDARQVEDALAAGRRQQLINLSVAVVSLLVVVVGATLAWRAFGPGPGRSNAALQFSPVLGTDSPIAVVGGPPVAIAELTVSLSDQVVVRAGPEPVDERVVTEPVDFFTVAPGAVTASLFSFNNRGQLALVGPDGFIDGTCFRVSVVTSDLRPLDTIRTAGCSDGIGREASVTCAGPSALILELTVESGEVELPEGGSGFADGVRIQLIADGRPDYEVATLRGTIAVDPTAEIVVPTFGGSAGDQLVVDLGSGRTGSCQLVDRSSGS